ncbi:adenosine specific kinase [Acanthamoeba castellanii str. Neff]|uniref:Adenosine specific kinase n=1 Tax=Acanthamoeba castellanii (strain ATCC 30010 / Neff) TaxID=1257118 RepID=L8GP09_ACACF|nr:adenosine specific kinase [Acanthamoeba castellanii str. Neff]ELR13881.1 adenosine specific kinase [Acanthamoeba castellanii str. Neff]
MADTGAPSQLTLDLVSVQKPDDMNFIFGTSHFIKTVEDVYEALTTSSPSIEFGLAFCEASGDRLVRWDGNSEELVQLAKVNALAIGAGHSFIIFMRNAYPINVLKRIQAVQEVVTIHCATANPCQIVLARSAQGKGVLGVIDGYSPLGVEDESKQQERRAFLRAIGHKK